MNQTQFKIEFFNILRKHKVAGLFVIMFYTVYLKSENSEFDSIKTINQFLKRYRLSYPSLLLENVLNFDRVQGDISIYITSIDWICKYDKNLTKNIYNADQEINSLCYDNPINRKAAY